MPSNSCHKSAKHAPKQHNHIQNHTKLITNTKIWRNLSSQVVLASATTIYVLTIWFSQTTFSNTSIKNGRSTGILSWLGFSSGIAILQTLQKVGSTLTNVALAQIFEHLGWMLASGSSENLLLSTFLCLSPTTALLGLAGFVVNRKARGVDRVWALCRGTFWAATWVAGLALFFNTDIGTVYQTGTIFNATAGVGSFNGSFVVPTLAFVNNSLSYWTLATASTFLLNPQFSTTSTPIACSPNDSSCESYLLPGGPQSLIPPPPSTNNDPVVVVHNSLSSQVEFVAGVESAVNFDSNDCTTYGEERYIVGLMFCVKRGATSNRSVIASVFICSTGVRNGHCRDPGPYLNASTTMSLFRRSAVVVGARSNNSIISVSSLSSPILTPLTDLPNFRLGLGWLLNYTAAGLPPESSIAFLFWNSNTSLGEHDWYVEAYRTLTSTLAFTSWFFSANNNGNLALAGSDTFSLLPSEYHITASTARPSTRIIINRGMVIVYVVLQGLPLLFCWAMVLWRAISRLEQVELSSFPLLDFLFKAEWHGAPELGDVRMEIAGDGEIRSRLKGVRITAHKSEKLH